MALSSWVDCLVSIRFDLDIGPKIEFIAPPEALTEEGKVKLLHCAFPDCNPDCGYNFIFYFTMPDCTTAAAQSFSQTVAPPTTGHTVPELYGAAFYRQKHDPKVPRRYVQQVVVLLSHLPYYNVHELILRVVAPRFCQCCRLSPDTGKVPVSSVLSPVPEAYFEVDQSYTAAHYTQDEVLRDAMQELAQWPSPHPQVRYSVNLLQQALVFLTPSHSLRQSLRATRSSYAAVRRPMSVDDRVEFVERVRGSARHRGSSFGNDVLPLFSLLGEQLHHLTYVWELVLRHEPLFILSNTPCVASATAFSVASLILPIQYNGTLRSYFTVQNEDFPRLSRMGKALPFPTHEALLVAGTNPFLLRSFSGWPSLLVVMDRNAAHMVNGSVASPASSAAREAHGGDLWGSRGLGSPPPPSKAAQAQPPRTVLLEELRAESSPLPAHGAGGLGASASASLSAATTGAGEGTNASASLFVESAGSSSSSTAIHTHPSNAVNRSTSPGRGIAGTPLTASSSTNSLFFSRRQVESLHTHVTVVPTSTGSGVALSALVGTPTSSAVLDAVTTTTTATLATSTTAVYHADPHATYALESSSDESRSASSRSSTPPSRPASFAAPASATATTAASSEAEDGPAPSAGTSASARSGRGDATPTPLTADTRTTPAAMMMTTTPTHHRVASTNPTASAAASGGEEGGLREVSSATAPTSVSSRISTSPPAALAAMPAPSASSVTLFTMRNYQTTVESVNAVDYRKRGGGHQEASRTNLQQRLHNYFDSSVHFLLNHAEQSKMLLKRLEMVSLLDAEAQRTSVTLSLHQWQGSPTAVSSPWRHTRSNSGSNVGGGSADAATPSAFPAVPPSPASTASTGAAAGHHGSAVEGGVTSCSHFSVADDILRKFFTSLTNEFLTPVTAWYTKVTTAYTAFHLCDRALCDSLLSPASFLSDFALRHRETAPLMWTQLHSFKTYKVIYERFAHGCLFKAYVSQLIDEDLRRQLDTFQIEEWVVRVPSEAERIDLLISLLSTIQRELNETLDPDVLFVTTATSVMASMAVGLREPHREQFMLKIGELKL